MEDLQVHFCTDVQQLLNTASIVKVKDADVLYVCIDVNPVAFNRGYYSVDLTFFFDVLCDICTSPLAPPIPVRGICSFQKRMILYGSEGAVKIFSSDTNNSNTCCTEGSTLNTNMPRVNVQVAKPIVLGSRIIDNATTIFDGGESIPASVRYLIGGELFSGRPDRVLLVTIGLFSIVQLERDVQMLIPAYDFCVPDKECDFSVEDPCELFKKLRFPTSEFFPPRLSDLDSQN